MSDLQYARFSAAIPRYERYLLAMLHGATSCMVASSYSGHEAGSSMEEFRPMRR